MFRKILLSIIISTPCLQATYQSAEGVLVQCPLPIAKLKNDIVALQSALAVEDEKKYEIELGLGYSVRTTGPWEIAHKTAVIIRGIVLAKNLIQALAAGSKDMDQQAKKDANVTLDETVTFLERARLILIKMGDLTFSA